VEDLSVTDYEKLGASGIITSLTSDVNQISSGINLFLRLLLRSPFIVIGATVMAFTVSPTLALIFVVTVAALSIIVALNMKRAVPLYSKTRTGLDRLVSAAHNGLAGVRVIRSYNRSEGRCKTFSR
jgi:ABC-type multidrug transport system fused ATPase/permease subunit